MNELEKRRRTAMESSEFLCVRSVRARERSDMLKTKCADLRKQVIELIVRAREERGRQKVNT